MLKNFTLTSLFLMIGLALFISFGNSAGPAVGAAGSPIEGGATCTNCHAGTVNSGPGSLSLDGDEGYTPGETHTFTIEVTDPTASRYGFQAIVVDGNNNAVGSFIAGTDQKVINSGGGRYVGHSTPSSNGSFTIEWAAPTGDVGQVNLYVSANAANGDGTNGGDNIYNTFRKLNATTSIDNPDAYSFSLYPNPASEQVNIQFPNAHDHQVYLINHQGQVLWNRNFSADHAQIPLTRFAQGVYTIKVVSENGVMTTQSLQIVH